MSSITWTNDHVRLCDLKPWERNPRRITRKAAERLAESWTDFGQVETVAIGPDDEVYNGHQRLDVLRKLYGDDYEVDVRRASRPLTEKEHEKLVVFLHAGAIGSWDWDALGLWNPVELQEWGFDADLLAGWQGDVDGLTSLEAVDHETPTAQPVRTDGDVPGNVPGKKSAALAASARDVGIEDDGKKHIVYVVLSGENWVGFQLLKSTWQLSSDHGVIGRMIQECLGPFSESS